jgi:GAF domain-containing protein
MLLIRRLHGMQRRLHDYSAMLQINLTATKRLDTAEQAQLALVQVHELLPLSASQLLLFQPGSSTLERAASREADGTSGPSAQSDTQELIQAAVQRGKQLWGQRRLSAQTPADGTTRSATVVSAVAMPLRAQDQIIGVLYLELAPGHKELADDQQELLARLCEQLALSLLTVRATRLAFESAIAQNRLAERDALLQMAARMASGDLMSPIQVQPSSELSPLATALDSMRRDLQIKVETLESNNREIHELNDELRRQIEQRSRRVLELALKSEDKRPMRSNHYAPDSLIGDHYRVVRLIGQGAMGSVYEVKRTTDGRHLAAKVLTARADKTTMVRFAREAQLLSRMTHPNLISIIDSEALRRPLRRSRLRTPDPAPSCCWPDSDS